MVQLLGHAPRQPPSVLAEFREAFHSFHILSGLMEIKRREFEDLKQGGGIVMEYV